VPLSIDVALVAYNRYDLTRSCLEHLAAQTREHRLLVCDNGSTDGTAERIAADRPDARIVRTQDNRGFA
jgi:GT2 family glycosyltransferase